MILAARPGALRIAALFVVLGAVFVTGQGAPAEPSPDLLLLAGQYDRAEQLARARFDGLQAARGNDSPEVAAAANLLLQARILNGRASSADTLSLARQTLLGTEARCGIDSPEVVPSLLNLEASLEANASFDEAVTVSQRSVAILEKQGAPAANMADALDSLGSAWAALGRQDRAVETFEKSLRLRESETVTAPIAAARTLENLGQALQRRGAYDRSGSLLRRAAALREGAAPGHPAYARTLDLLAQQLWFEGRIFESWEMSERAVALGRSTLRADHPAVALSLRLLAATVADLGDLDESRRLRSQALAIAERNFGPDHHITAEYLHSLASADLREGNYASARRGFRRALAIFEGKYGPWHEYVATTLFTLARAEAGLGDYPGAQREQARAVEVHARVGGPNHPYVANALTELAVLYRKQGLPHEALPLFGRALAIRESRLGASHRYVAQTLAEMASTEMQLGHPANAQRLVNRALGIWDQLKTPDSPEYASVLVVSADIQARQGHHEKAMEHYARALEIRAKAFGTSHPLHAEAEAGLALALAHLGQGEAALTAAVSAESAARNHARLMLRSLPERQALSNVATRPQGLPVALSLATAGPDAAGVALDALIRSRALVLEEMAARQHAGVVQEASTDRARRSLASAQQRLASLLTRGPGSMSAAQYGSLVERTRSESERAEEMFADASAHFRVERYRGRVGFDEVQSALPADGALVSFYRFDRSFFDESPRRGAGVAGHSRARTTPWYLAFLTRRNGPPVVEMLGPAQEIDGLVARWREDIAAEVRTPTAISPTLAASSRTSGRALRQKVWDRLVAHLNGANRVFIVPDGSLNLVPFAALPTGSHSYLVEGHRVIHYLSTERDLVAPPQLPPVARGLLAIGGPSFDERPLRRPVGRTHAEATSVAMVRGPSAGCGSLASVTFDALRGAQLEARELGRLWNASGDGDESSAARVLVGREASEGTVKQEAPRYRVLHLATHGFFLGSPCAPNVPRSRGVGGLIVPQAPAAPESPLLLSGIALAGANRRTRTSPDEGEDDGILTANEVASMNLEGTEWAVLSACDTGVGTIAAGEGVLGLRRAFQVAGAHSVIMSLWSVDDQAARAWMRALYQGRFQQGLSTADAVHNASVRTLRARRAKGISTHPFYWAGFVAAGDWR